MNEINKERTRLALLNASEMIRGHVECGMFPEDVCEKDEKGLKEYEKACTRAAKMIEKLSNRYAK